MWREIQIPRPKGRGFYPGILMNVRDSVECDDSALQAAGLGEGDRTGKANNYGHKASDLRNIEQ